MVLDLEALLNNTSSSSSSFGLLFFDDDDGNNDDGNNGNASYTPFGQSDDNFNDSNQSASRLMNISFPTSISVAATMTTSFSSSIESIGNGNESSDYNKFSASAFTPPIN
mmetsp:Transcript_30455/g.39249  ORF Transcript_30455/g.39249 Transcript_30455/m.39249 type:complete len:110 (-) Transcript_30455:238-567(-)